MSKAVRAKKSGKNAKTASVDRQPQLFTLSQDIPQNADAPKKTDVDLFTIPTAQATNANAHISPAYASASGMSAFKPQPAPISVPRPKPIVLPQDDDDADITPLLKRGLAAEAEDAYEAPVPVKPPVPAPVESPVPLKPAVPEPVEVPVPLPQPSYSGMPARPVRPEETFYEEQIPNRKKRTEPEDTSYTARNQNAASGKHKRHTEAHKEHDAQTQRASHKKKAEHTSSRKSSTQHKKQKPHEVYVPKKEKPTDLSPVYDYVNGKKKLDIPEGVQGATEALTQEQHTEPFVPVKIGKGKTRPASIKEEREKRRKQEERLTYLIVAFVILFVIASGFLLRYLWNYRRTAAEYAELTDTYVAVSEPAEDDETEDAYPQLDINFPGLFALNSDLTGWLYVPACNISYPIVQTTDNDYYLNHTFLQNVSSCGAIFIDYGDHADFSDFNTFIYGHNMQDGSMFGALHKLWQDESLVDKEPYFYVYLSSGSVRKYRIVSYYQDAGDSQSYLRVETDEHKQAYIDMIMDKSTINPAASPVTASLTVEPDATFATLSTCHGGINSGQRFLVHGQLVGVY